MASKVPVTSPCCEDQTDVDADSPGTTIWLHHRLVGIWWFGQSSFRGDDIFGAILEDASMNLYIIAMLRDAVSILQKLLTRDPTQCLGSGKADAEEIKRHPFFKDLSFDDVLNKCIPPPYFPTIFTAS
ncbi:uncharacterized protein F5147DRAFT_770009 [Suillus discolor]|uniref:Uncharacterized protein n=1 Tax=Suillus discolor TaxID=1912936 RepID=A0A9P7FD31_9AGAM|nr:uncharacterized protein F5147DRAFT_770009 [Suillus discolor]KAG2114691.1 hypothetical protein F5147DRAFT_770009 [Suillus discolor]